MSENEKSPNPGEQISEEQLDAVAGGGGTGTESDPERSPICWFKSDGAPYPDGRTPCRSKCKEIYRGVYGPEKWHICSCLDTDYCIDKLHKHCGKNDRTRW